MNSKCEEINKVFKSAVNWMYKKIKEFVKIEESCKCRCCEKKTA